MSELNSLYLRQEIKYVLEEYPKIDVNELIKRKSFRTNLRIQRIYNCSHLLAKFFSELEKEYPPLEEKYKGRMGKRIFMQKNMGTDYSGSVLDLIS